MWFAQLDRRLRFLPLGLLWGLLGGGLHTYYFLYFHPPAEGDQINWLLLILYIACTCLVATLLSSALLKRELSSIRWVVNWVITGVLSCVGGLAVFYVVLPSLIALYDLVFYWLPFYPRSWYSMPQLFVGIVFAWFWFVLALGPKIAIASTMAALLSAPVSLVGRRLILSRESVAESAGGGSQS